MARRGVWWGRPIASWIASLRKDENVFEELLGTEKFYVFHSGDNEAMTAFSERIGKDLPSLQGSQTGRTSRIKDLLKHKEFSGGGEDARGGREEPGPERSP